MPKRINALYKFVIKIPIVFRRKDMKFKKILSLFLAFAVAFGAVSFAPFGNNGSFLNSAIVAEAKTGHKRCPGGITAVRLRSASYQMALLAPRH